MSLNQMILCSKLKNGLCKIDTKSQFVTKSRLHCLYIFVTYTFNLIDSPFYDSYGMSQKNQGNMLENPILLKIKLMLKYFIIWIE